MYDLRVVCLKNEGLLGEEMLPTRVASPPSNRCGILQVVVVVGGGLDM